MSRKKSIVQFSENLSISIASNQSIQLRDKEESFSKDRETLKGQIEVVKEEDDNFNDDLPPIRIEYTTKRDSIEKNRCLMTLKPPRKRMPVFWKYGTDSTNFGYTLKTDFIGDTRMISVAPTGKQDNLDDYDYDFRGSFLERSTETLRRGTGISSDTMNTIFKKKVSTEYGKRTVKTLNQEQIELFDATKRAYLRKQLTDESYSVLSEKISVSNRISVTAKPEYQEDYSKSHQLNVYSKAADKSSFSSEDVGSKRPLQSSVVNTFENNTQISNSEDNNSLRSSIDDKFKEIVPLEKKLMQAVLSTYPESKLIHQRVYKEKIKAPFMKKNNIKSSSTNKLFGEKHEFETHIKNDPGQSILEHKRKLDLLKSAPALPKIRKLPAENSLSYNKKIERSLVSFQEIPNDSDVLKKLDESILPSHAEIGTDEVSSSVNKTKSDEEISLNARKDLTVTNKPFAFRRDPFVVDGSKTFLKRPVQLSLKIIRNHDGNTDYKISAKKGKFGLKDDNIFTKQLNLPKGLYQFPQIAAPKNVSSMDKVTDRDSEIEKELRLIVSDNSGEIQRQFKLPFLETSFSTPSLQYFKKNASLVFSKPENSRSSLGINEMPSFAKIDRKLKMKEKLSLESNLSQLNQLKDQIVPSRKGLIKPDGTEIETSETKTFKGSNFFENKDTWTKLSDTLSRWGYKVKHQHDDTNTEQQDFSISRENVLQTSDGNGDAHSLSVVESAKEIINRGEDALLNDPFVAPEDTEVGEEDMPTSNERSSSVSTRSSDILMKIDSENLQNIVKEYLMSDFTYGEEEMETSGTTKYSEDKVSVHKEEQPQKFDYNYRGTYDSYNLRSGFGCLHWDASETRTYCGYFLYNSLHGKGHYFIKEDKCLNFYNGYLYGNELYGYGQIVHDNADKFEGLFKNNSRYGPGVFTHPNGTQDVGLWYGNSLLRLIFDLSRCIPTFGRSMFGKIKLLKFNKAVRLKTHQKDKAREILENLTSNAKILARYKELYNPYVRNQNSLFFDKNEYDGEYFRNEDCYVSILKSSKRRKSVHDGTARKTGDENERKISEEQAELMKTIENVEAKLANFRTQIEELQVKQDILSPVSGSISTPGTTLDDTQRNKLYKEELFYTSVLEFLNNKLNKYNKESPSGATSMVQKIRVNSLLAWNNNDVLVDMQLHTFRCRSSEENICFEVKHIIKGERKNFGQPGEHEENCKEFLESCRAGDEKKILTLLFKSNINPDVSDSRGNSGLHLATFFDHVNIIKILANNGANLTVTNDEGLTPLNLALLRYLELIYAVRRWEFAFLSEHEVSSNEKKQFFEWVPYESFWISILRTPVENRRNPFSADSASINDQGDMDKFKASKNWRTLPNPLLKTNATKLLKDLVPEFVDPFVFGLDYNRNSSKISSSSISNTRSVEYVQDKVVEKSKPNESISSKELQKRLDRITESVNALLRYGADLMDAMPFPPFFIALFTKSPNIVESFLKRNADPNRLYQGMTPLQIICCLAPSEEICYIMDLLIHYAADVNLLSDPFVWRECDNDLVRNYAAGIDETPQGKNALHFICLREDVTEFGNIFLCRMAETLLQSRIRTGLLHLGHSHVSMAVLKGNVDLIRCLSKFVDVRRPLGNGLGNALTVLALRRYPSMIQFHKCKDVIDCLLDLGVSPFDPIYNYYNIFEFFDDEWPPSLGENVKSWNAYATHIKRYQILIKQSSFTHIQLNCNAISKIYIRDKSRSILDVIIRYKAVMYLYNFFREMLVNKNTVHLAKLIGSSNEAAANLEVIFRCGKLPQWYFCDDIVKRLFEYVDEVNKRPKNEEIKHNIRFDNLKKSKYVCDSLELYPITYWVSDENLYKCEVCYFCMHKRYKVLLKCPLCGIVKFCSDRCNYLSKKFQTIHACPVQFYQNIFKENQIFINKNEPIPLYGIDLDFENARKR